MINSQLKGEECQRSSHDAVKQNLLPWKDSPAKLVLNMKQTKPLCQETRQDENLHVSNRIQGGKKNKIKKACANVII